MKKAVCLLVAALVIYGACDLVRAVRAAYTTGYSRVYSHAVGLVMSPAFDSLGLRGRGIRIGVLDAGFGGFLTDRWTRGLRIGAFRDFTGDNLTCSVPTSLPAEAGACTVGVLAATVLAETATHAVSSRAEATAGAEIASRAETVACAVAASPAEVASRAEIVTHSDAAAFFGDATDHGTRVCANIGGFSGDTLLGLACEATYFLAKTDCACRELRAEELQMIRGIEWLLEQDVDLITSSLGYTVFDDFDGYSPRMLDGRTSVLSRYLDSLLSARPELIFVQSAGNEGDKAWRHISFPGDVRAVLTVGESAFDGRKRARASGIGPAEGASVKPDFALPASPPGTSFSTPVVTGLCACLLELHRMERDSLADLLRASASRAGNPDREVGHGFPQTGPLLELLEQKKWTNR